ncbi:MAG TPA: phosphatase PAP2 family protein [Pyrinomonadaceae bacterium]|jgi:undecaprenyl-diphosphatase|nr:phosphatase PAP2 family protein [Pyrinomonadaceae bacterium]
MRRILHNDRVLIPVVGFMASATLLTLLGLLATGHYFDEFDSWFRGLAQQQQSPHLTSLFLTVTLFGSTRVLIGLGTILIAIHAMLRKWQTAGFFLITMAGQITLDQSFKAIFGRERPEALIEYVTPLGSSFPSGHALASVSFYAIVAWLVTRSGSSRFLAASVWVGCIAFAFLIGASRVYIGIHNASDVMGGFLAGAIWTASMIAADKLSSPPNAKPKNHLSS